MGFWRKQGYYNAKDAYKWAAEIRKQGDPAFVGHKKKGRDGKILRAVYSKD